MYCAKLEWRTKSAINYAAKLTGGAPALNGRPPYKKVREGIRDTNFSPLSRSLDFPGSLLGRAAAALPVNAAKAILAYYFALCLSGHAAAEGSGPPSYFPRTTIIFALISRSAYGNMVKMRTSATPEKAISGPLHNIENQRLRKAKTTFETRRNISNVVFLRSYVSIPACGTVF